MIRPCVAGDFDEIHKVINDAAVAYKGVIPEDRWHDPYMTQTELQDQIRDGVRFFCYSENERILGVMGMQDKREVYLIRHAYVVRNCQSRGIGSKLLRQLIAGLKKPILVGTWKDATWAIEFYVKNGFRLVTEEEKEILLRKYWTIPERQVETSVVLSDETFEAEKERLLWRSAT